MRRILRGTLWTAALLGSLAFANQASAARVRYHYVPTGPDESAAVTQSGGSERLTWRGRWEASDCPTPKPTCFPTFRHPDTGRSLTVPLALPEGTPQMLYRTNRVIYDYSGFTVEVHFLSDGSADVIYTTGLLGRPPTASFP
jgi:hypothetical protein